jgi:hypothetical protein
LVSLKADKTLKNKKGLTAYDIAKSYTEEPEYEEIAKYLSESDNQKTTTKKIQQPKKNKKKNVTKNKKKTTKK